MICVIRAAVDGVHGLNKSRNICFGFRPCAALDRTVEEENAEVLASSVSSASISCIVLSSVSVYWVLFTRRAMGERRGTYCATGLEEQLDFLAEAASRVVLVPMEERRAARTRGCRDREYIRDITRQTRLLKAVFPRHIFLGEEQAKEDRCGPRREGGMAFTERVDPVAQGLCPERLLDGGLAFLTDFLGLDRGERFGQR